MEALRRDDLDGRHAGDRLRHFAFRRHRAQHAAALGDEKVAVGQEGQRPRALQLVRDDVDSVAGLALRRRRFGLAGERGLRLARLRGDGLGCEQQKRSDTAREHCRPPFGDLRSGVPRFENFA